MTKAGPSGREKAGRSEGEAAAAREENEAGGRIGVVTVESRQGEPAAGSKQERQ